MTRVGDVTSVRHETGARVPGESARPPHAGSVRAVEALELARALIRCPSVTPTDAGALGVVADVLTSLGFNCHRLSFEEDGTEAVENLYARLGNAPPHLCFAGHTDVVPVGDQGDWSTDPFAAEVRDGQLWGRGAVDMKSAVACFVAAVGRFLAATTGPVPGSISLLLTGDEEGPAINGTVKVLRWLAARDERPDACLVGEPTCAGTLGSMIKVGRRGSLNGVLTVSGTQGHVAYPQHADNPIPTLMRLLQSVDGCSLDGGTEYFQPSRVEITSIDVDNRATNVIPAKAIARFNVRFNTNHTGAGVHELLKARFRAAMPEAHWHLAVRCSGEAFLCPPGALGEIIADSVRDVTGIIPAFGTTGGTSDARFLKDLCPVAEFGMVGDTAHKVDEAVALQDIDRLTAIYAGVLHRWFRGTAVAE